MLDNLIGTVYLIHQLHIMLTGATGSSILVYMTIATSFVILFFLGTFIVFSATVYNIYKIKKRKGSLE